MSDRYRSYRCIGRDRQLKADNKYLQLESESLNSYIAGHESSSSYNETLEDLVTHNFCTQDKTQKMTNVQRYEYKRQCLKKNVLKTQSLIQSVTADYDEILSLEKAKTRQLQCEVSKLHSELECLGEKLQSITSTNTILKTQVTEKESEVNAHIKEIETELKKTETERDLAFRVKAELEVQAKSDENRIRSLEKKNEETWHHRELHDYGGRLIELKENHERGGKGTNVKEGKEFLTISTGNKTVERQGHHNKNIQFFVSQDVAEGKELKLTDEQLTIINLIRQVEKGHQMLTESLETIHKKDKSIEDLNKRIKEMEERLFEQRN